MGEERRKGKVCSDCKINEYFFKKAHSVSMWFRKELPMRRNARGRPKPSEKQERVMNKMKLWRKIFIWKLV